eukprot:5985820-Amphidinium_carterae.1
MRTNTGVHSLNGGMGDAQLRVRGCLCHMGCKVEEDLGLSTELQPVPGINHQKGMTMKDVPA